MYKLEVAVFQWIIFFFFYDPFSDCGLNLRAVALSFFPRSPCSVPDVPSTPLLGIKQLTFLLLFLTPFRHLISLNDKPLGTGILSLHVAAKHLGQGGVGHQLGLLQSVVPKRRSESLQVGLGAPCKWLVDFIGPKCRWGW